VADLQPNNVDIYMQQQRLARHKRKPQAVASPVATGLLTVGSTLSCTTGAWIGGGPYVYSYQWYRNGTAISGATSASYLTALAGSHMCVVTASATWGAYQFAASNALAIV
jgi:hypothetical protein